MLNMTLYKREMKGSLKLLLIFGAVLTLYISIIIRMYDREMMATLDSFYEVMPEEKLREPDGAEFKGG